MKRGRPTPERREPVKQRPPAAGSGHAALLPLAMAFILKRRAAYGKSEGKIFWNPRKSSRRLFSFT